MLARKPTPTSALLHAHRQDVDLALDRHSSALGPSVFLAAARAGEFDTFRVGKRYGARADDVRAYIERQKVAPLHAGRGRTPRVDELDAQLGTRLRSTRSRGSLGPAVATARRR